jgi:hypothetical protein
MNKDTQMLFEAYGTMYRGPKTEQDSKDYGMNITPFMHIIHKLSKGTFDTDSDQDLVAKGELQGIFEVDTVDGHRQVVLTNDAIEVIGAMHSELKDKFWECGKCKADYAGCGAAKHDQEKSETDKDIHDLAKPSSREHYKDEEEQRRLDSKCWSGYHKAGTKMKGGIRVNNCVKSEQEEDGDEEGDLMVHMKHKGMISKKADTSTGEYGHRREEEESGEHAMNNIINNLLNISQKMWKEMNMDSFYSARDLEVIKSHAESILRRVKDVAEQKSKVTSVSHNGYRRILKTFK